MTALHRQEEGIPLPRATGVSKRFWDGCAEHRLLFQRCRACGKPIFNPAPLCRFCTSTDLAWEESAGRGAIYSWTIAWRPMAPVFRVPYAPVIVDLDEGYQMLSNLVGCDTDDVRCGLRVEVAFHSAGAITLPYFTPAPAS